MEAILNDNGGEFTADKRREVKGILNVEDLTTRAESIKEQTKQVYKKPKLEPKFETIISFLITGN